VLSTSLPVMALDLRAGRLLVATPDLADPNFSHAVVLLLEHNDEGAFGVVLNRPSDVDVAAALPGWERLSAPPDVVFVGGPVQQDGVVALAAGTDDVLEKSVLPAVGVVDLDRDPLVAGAGLDRVRVFAGYAGWGAGQLESEVADGGWFVVDATPGDVFSDDPEELWLVVLHRQGGIFTTIPEDPSLN
jgi:putative transcriptional regulator